MTVFLKELYNEWISGTAEENKKKLMLTVMAAYKKKL